MTTLVLAAPLAGWATRLDELPDPAFAQGLVGDGVAIDPISNELCAPCEGVVTSVHRARHACTLRCDNGAEILLHIGIDSVALRGEGFEVLVAEGKRVRTRDPLIRFDLDLLTRRAKSLHTPVLLVGGDGLAVIERVVDREVAVGDFLLSIARVGAAPEATATAAGADASAQSAAVRRVRIAAPHGLHARPAAAFARLARRHAGEVSVAVHQRTANGKSTSALLALDARRGDELAITVRGAQAEPMAGGLAALIAGDAEPPAVTSTAVASNGVSVRAGGRDAPILPATRFAPGEEVVLVGASAAAGVAIGRVVRLADASAEPEVARDGAGPTVEQARLAGALSEVTRELEQTIAGAQSRSDAVAGEILRAQLDLIEDPELASAASREIAAGRSAAWAWHTALHQVADVLRGLNNPVLAERTGDLRDLERRTLARLAGGAGGRVPAELPDGAVLVADELLPSELAAVPAGRLAGICTARGGATSHVAILATAMAIPAVVAIGDSALGVPDGAPIIIDGDHGQATVFPAAATREAVQRTIADRGARRRAQLAGAHHPASTADGVAISVLANLGRVGDARAARDNGAEGCGLLRTEFLFLDRNTAPSEDEQVARYQEIADALDGRPLVIRTLDAGGDKPLPYLPQKREDNPALGVRGVRLSLRHPELLRTQLRAILRVRPAGVCRIMVPMIASLAELRVVRGILEDERRALDAAPVALGAMIEVPTAALIAAALARDAEFFSIGTNDLSQYALAIDRGNSDLAAGLTALDPGVLRLIASTVHGARSRGRPVSVCGGAAADPCTVPILIGLGVDTLSVAPSQVPEVKAIVRTLSRARCRDVATAALELETSEAVRALVVNTWPGLAAHHAARHDGPNGDVR
jgi:phosphocarrier protein FPr